MLKIANDVPGTESHSCRAWVKTCILKELYPETFLPDNSRAMEYIVEILTRRGKICERYATYEEARRRVDSVPVDLLAGIPFIFRELPDGSQRLVREDGKPLQWHRLEDDDRATFDEPLPLDENVPEHNDGPAIRPVEPEAWDEKI
jgi:hypothetical protein